MDRSAAAPTLVEQASDRLAFAIASGEYPPGARLPSVRSLAAQYGINPSTVQVVLARLTSVGFVEAHDRVGYVVRDIRLVGGIETWRHLFRFSRQLPDLAAAMLADILATRRRLVEDAVRLLARGAAPYDPGPVRRAADQFELLAAGSADTAVLARAELHTLRLTIAATGQGLALAVFNSVSDMLLAVPEALAVLYRDAPLHVAAWRGLLAAWEAGTIAEQNAAVLGTLMAQRDGETVTRFRAELTRPARSRRR